MDIQEIYQNITSPATKIEEAVLCARELATRDVLVLAIWERHRRCGALRGDAFRDELIKRGILEQRGIIRKGGGLKVAVAIDEAENRGYLAVDAGESVLLYLPKK